MAPELRKKKSARSLSGVVDAASPKEIKKSKNEKRKASEHVSPIPVKRLKSTKTKNAPEKPAQAKNNEETKSAGSKEANKKRTKKAQEALEPEPQPPSETDEDDVPDDMEDEEVDTQTQALVSAFDSEDEYEDEPEPANAFKRGQDVGKVPKTVKKLPEAGAKEPSEPGVMYLGRIPHGFAEREMKSYFSQFGEVTRLRLSRNKKTGRSKHFAFLEFADKEVAEIVVQTMDSYLLYGHILRAKMVPQNQVHPELWKGANRRFKKVPWNKMAGRHLEKPAGVSTWHARISKEQQRRSARAEKLKELMDYEFDGPALKQPTVKVPVALEGSNEAKTVVTAPLIATVPGPAKEAGDEKRGEVSVSEPAKSAKKKKTTAKKVKA